MHNSAQFREPVLCSDDDSRRVCTGLFARFEANTSPAKGGQSAPSPRTQNLPPGVLHSKVSGARLACCWHKIIPHEHSVTPWSLSQESLQCLRKREESAPLHPEEI